jgi:hypothetical protein
MSRTSFSLRAKLMAIVMATTLVALSLAGGALALFELSTIRVYLSYDLKSV